METIMSKPCCLNRTTELYLAAFNRILQKMICKMSNAKLTNSISHNFIVQMIPHHQAAIEMSENILKYTSNNSVENIASNIITEQTKSIEKMLSIEKSCNCLVNQRQELQLYQTKINQVMQTMFSNMSKACCTNQINCNFMWEMIPHHEGAVLMSEITLQFNICPELKPILDSIISSQKKGISEMQNLLHCLEC